MIDWVDHLMWERIIPVCGAIIGSALIVCFYDRFPKNKKKEAKK